MNLDADLAKDEKLITEWKLAGGRSKDRRNIDYGSPLYWALYRDDQRKKVAKREAKKGKVGAVTDLNLFTLANVVVRHGGHVRFPNAFEATERNGIKRCIDGGYVRVEGKQLALTPSGTTAVADYLITELEREAKQPAKLGLNGDDYYKKRQDAKVASYEKAMSTLGSERAE